MTPISISATAPAIDYIDPDNFNEIVDRLLSVFFDAQVAAAEKNTPDIDREKLDQDITEVLLRSGVWPQSWADLMTDDEKAVLIGRITGVHDQLKKR